MSQNITPYKDSGLGKKEQVAQMFDTISGNYDGLNRVMTFGIDIKWRKKVLELVAAKNPDTILDIATGTGDLAILMSATNAKEIIGADISEGMMEVGRKKVTEKNHYAAKTFFRSLGAPRRSGALVPWHHWHHL